MSTTILPNMNLVIPVVSSEPGPAYATEINAAMALIDSHDHTVGYGARVPTGGLNINADLPIGNNNLTGVRSVRFQTQTSVAGGSDLRCAYVITDDLYYRDGSGNEIRLTNAGGVAGSPGSISGLVAPASATYVPVTQTFVWQSNVAVAANLDARSILLRNATSSSSALTLSAPLALASDYTITLPAVSSSVSFITIDANGKLSPITPFPLTQAGMGNTGIKITSSISFSTTNTSVTPVSGLGLSLVTTGRPVFVGLVSGDATQNSYIGAEADGASNIDGQFFLVRDSVSICLFENRLTVSSTANLRQLYAPCSSLWHLDIITAGTHNYSVSIKNNSSSSGASDVTINNARLVAYEL